MFTIITSTLNCKHDLEKTAISILSQNYEELQWIVIDGDSTDGTQEIIHKYKKIIDYTISESDLGIYYAWNKALKFVKNKWVLFLGAGDILASNNLLNNLHNIIINDSEENKISYYYGNVLTEGRIIEIISSGRIENNQWDLYRPKLPCHQGVIHNSIMLGKLLFDVKYQIVADTKLLLLLNKMGANNYIDLNISIIKPDGLSQNIKYSTIVMNEFLKLENELKYKIPRINKIKYIIKIKLKHSIYKIIGEKKYSALKIFFANRKNIF